MKTPILGSSSVARSVNAACNRMVNLFPEIVDSGKEPAFLQRAPGLKGLLEVGDGPLRGAWTVGDVNEPMFVVSGDELWKIEYLEDGAIQVGTGLTGEGRVSIADNGLQLFIATDPDAFIYDKAANTLTKITDPDFPGARTVAYIDGYFVFDEPFSQKIWWTKILDGSQIDALDFASAEGLPDNIVGLTVYNRQIWIFGYDSTEIWENIGDAAMPFARSGNGFFEKGCIAPLSVAKMDNRVFWLGRDAAGSGIVYASKGYDGERISTHSVEQAIQRYGNMNDAEAYAYQQDGHSFYVLNFPFADTTWAYDIATGTWTERAGFVGGELTRHPTTFVCNFRNRILGDGGAAPRNSLYEFDMDTYDYAGQPQRWLRSWRAIGPGQNKLVMQAHHSLQLDCESGTGLQLDPGYDPQVMLRWSDDGGHTWSREHWASMGKVGEYYKRVIWRRLGMTRKIRDRVYEVSGTDPVKIAIMGAELIGIEEAQ